MNGNREIFEVPGVYENPRRQVLTLASTVYVKCLKYMKLVEFRHQIYQRIILCGQLAGINLDSCTLDKLLFTNLIFLASKREVPMINKKNIIFASTQVQKMAKFERKQQNYLYFRRRKTLRK